MKKILILLFCPMVLLAQSSSLGIVTKVEPNRVILRWMPLDYQTWQSGMTSGYDLYRYESEDSIGTVKRINQHPIKPLPFDQWKSKGSYAQVVQKLLSEEAPTDTIAQNFHLSLAIQMSNMDSSIAEGLGMYFIDTTLSKSKSYAYLLLLEGGKIAFTERIKPTIHTKLIAPELLESTYKDSTFYLKWRMTDPLLQSAYVVEMSDNSQHTWRQVTDAPILASEEVDSLGNLLISYSMKIPKYYQSYYFRVRAISPFGILSEASSSKYVYAYRDRLPKPELRYDFGAGGSVELCWDFPESYNFDIRGFSIYRSSMPDSNFVEYSRVKRESRYFRDTQPLTEGYYRLGIADWVGEMHQSMVIFVQLEDSLAPAKPIWKSSEMDCDGTVTLSWKQNKEKDLSGYRVYYSDMAKSEFSLLTPTLSKDSVFTTKVSLNLLNKKLYYTIRAYDNRLNASESSDTLVLLRPDTLRPVSANILHYVLSDTSIYLEWANSPSLDLSHTYLLRKSSTDSLCKSLLKFSSLSGIRSYLDTTAQENTEYTYSLVSVDDSGLLSDSSQIRLTTSFSGIRKALSGLRSVGDSEKRSIQIFWDIPSRKVKRYTLYRRGPEDGYLSVYRVFSGEYGSFTDQGLQLDRKYVYRLMALYEDNSRSELSAECITLIPTPQQ